MSKKATNTMSFEIGDRCAVATAATGHETAFGTVTNISKSGWYIVTLDEPTRFPGCKDGKLSARISSMAYESTEKAASKPAPGSIAAMLADANADAPAPKAPKAAKTPKAPAHPTECPECGLKLEESKDEDGNTTLTCPDEECGWEETYEADKEAASRMAEALRQARQHYTKDKRPDGSATAHCGDAIAKELRDMEPEETANLADKVLQQPHGFHFAKYQNLNNGQIRMNSGNRIRAYWKKINEDGNEAEINRVGILLNLIETDE